MCRDLTGLFLVAADTVVRLPDVGVEPDGGDVEFADAIDDFWGEVVHDDEAGEDLIREGR